MGKVGREAVKMNEYRSNTSKLAKIVGLLFLGAVTACTPSRSDRPANVDIKGSDPNRALEQTGTNTLNNSVIEGADAN